MHDFQSIERLVRQLAARIDIEGVTIFDRPQGDGSPYVEVAMAYHFVTEERGIELERRTTRDLDELLYWLFDSITFAVACDFELRHRKPGEDSRRQLFAKQEELLARLSPAWGSRKAGEHGRILARHPFNDSAR